MSEEGRLPLQGTFFTKVWYFVWQIVGLTASLGTGKASSVDRAEEHIILVSANLDTEAISTVRENQAELQKYANNPDQETFVAEKSDQDPFEKIISKVIKDGIVYWNIFSSWSGLPFWSSFSLTQDTYARTSFP